MPEQGPSYEQTKTRDLDNIARFENFSYAANNVTDRGKRQEILGYFGFREAFKRGIGMEGVLEAYDAQLASAVGGLGGVNAPLLGVIARNANYFNESLNRLKIGDILPYIRDKLGIEILEKDNYKDLTLDQLEERREDEARLYFTYIKGLVQDAVEHKVGPLALEEKARFDSEQVTRQFEAYEARRQQQPQARQRPPQHRGRNRRR